MHSPLPSDWKKKKKALYLQETQQHVYQQTPSQPCSGSPQSAFTQSFLCCMSTEAC